MPGFELWSDVERKHLNDVVQNGVLMRYGFDGSVEPSGDVFWFWEARA